MPSVASRVWPNLFVVGAPRAGTTSLWRYLDSHPEIWMAPMKEPNFFSGLRHRTNPEAHDEASYLRLFEEGVDSKLRGEASPSYLRTEAVPTRIRRVSPDARILISLRDPVERTHSAYWLRVRTGEVDRPLFEAVLDELERPDGRIVTPSFYADAVGRYLEAFPGAVHLLFFERLADDPRGEMRRVFEFLGVGTTHADHFNAKAHNAHALPRSPLAESLYNSPRFRAAARRVAPLGMRLRLQALLLKRLQRSAIDPETEAFLAELFAPDVERLRVLLGRDLPWPRFARQGD